MTKENIAQWFKTLQDQICSKLENTDASGKKFMEDLWERPEGGGGRSRVFTEGNIIEKGGVNFSAVYGQTPAKILEALKLEQADFFATGVSIVLHASNPNVPIIHMNVRYFEMTNGTYWFGGGIDLTPIYVNPKQAKTFHQKLKTVCDKHDASFYPKFKIWADDYFFIKHRNETRGIGGIFFDHLNESSYKKSKEELFEFVKDVGLLFTELYCPLMEENGNLPISEEQKKWQLLRRSRYVEFNLLYDKGTKFGLDTNGRVESILMSMPPLAKWEYNHIPTPDSTEEKTLQWLKKDINWIVC